jgi:hypothetical protein
MGRQNQAVGSSPARGAAGQKRTSSPALYTFASCLTSKLTCEQFYSMITRRWSTARDPKGPARPVCYNWRAPEPSLSVLTKIRSAHFSGQSVPKYAPKLTKLKGLPNKVRYSQPSEGGIDSLLAIGAGEDDL